jgi:exonuclease SbcD
LHATLVEQIVEADAHLLILTGDLFHAKSTPAERNAMAEFLVSAAERVPVVVVKGNHDAAGDLDIFECLAARNSITVMTRPMTEIVGTAGGDVAVYGIPWFDKANLVADLAATVDAEATRNLTIDAARRLLTVASFEIAAARKAGLLPILAGHLMVAGCETSTGQTLIGTTVELAPGDLADVGAEYVALGHIHKAQEWHGGRVAYAGSTWRQNFGEAEAKGWRLVTFEDGRFASNEFVELPARRIVLLSVDFTTGDSIDGLHLRMLDAQVRDGDLVRCRYTVKAEDLHLVNEGRMEEWIRKYGAAEVKLEAVIVQEARVRSEAIVRAVSNWERVEATWQAKGIEVDEATRARSREKLAGIETREREVSNAA